ncbi:MAG: tetratricopeptide repeat protein [Pirellulaceae bacterium]|jgi:tetratricopeptide (TPR) repeat protein|nr:tetratricopeptide repeat protein [Thermoguttaceae bacterium]MDI9444727.1 tetratricopeptide repeat protein [Planctomycetota bacterium]NLZ02271.1 tetratricopeptide repeat protein [Pirellulaceae bacterium]
MYRTCILFALLGAVGCGRSAEESFQKGVAAQQAGRFEEAIAAYSAAIESDSQLAMAYFNRGLARLEVEDFEGAIQDLSRTLDLDKESPDAFLARGTAFQAIKRDDEAVLDFTAAMELNQLDADIYRQRAFSWQALDESDAAIADLGMAIRLEPDRLELYLDRAEVHRQRGGDSGASVDETLAEFTRKIVESDDPEARRARGRAFFIIAEYELALADLSAVLKKEPADETALLTRGQTLYVLGNDEDALADYTAVIDAGGKRAREALVGRAVLYETRDDFAAAIDDYKRAIQASPEDDDLLARCAWLLGTCPDSKLRDGKQAVKYAERAGVLTDWKDWFCLDAYAAACAEARDFENAVARQKQAVAIGPEDQLGQLQQRLDAYRNHQPYHAGDEDLELRH